MASQADQYHHRPDAAPFQVQQYQQQQYQQQQPQYQQEQQQQHQQQQQQQHQYQQQPRRPQLSHLQYSQASSEQLNNGQAKPRSFSVHSHKTHRSSGSKHDIHESHEEKEARRLHTKADPSLAMTEAEPSAVASMRPESTHISLRAIQHRDSWGNPIADPDKSNPTRNRWERPLDTIRSFEAAIDGGYRRKSMSRTDSDSVANWNRRSSFQPQSQPRFPQESYYGNRPMSYRAESQYGPTAPGTARNSLYDPQGLSAGGYNGGYGRQMPRDRSQRMQSESNYHVYGREQGVYPMPHKDRSYETVTSAAHSGNSDPAGYQTDPTSSDNSSIDRAPAKRREPVNDYGIGFSQNAAYDAPNFSVGAMNHQQPPPPPAHGGHQGMPPPVPRKQATVLRRQPTQQSQNNEKRKSWFSRRFSKKG